MYLFQYEKPAQIISFAGPSRNVALNHQKENLAVKDVVIINPEMVKAVAVNSGDIVMNLVMDLNLQLMVNLREYESKDQ